MIRTHFHPLFQQIFTRYASAWARCTSYDGHRAQTQFNASLVPLTQAWPSVNVWRKPPFYLISTMSMFTTALTKVLVALNFEYHIDSLVQDWSNSSVLVAIFSKVVSHFFLKQSVSMRDFGLWVYLKAYLPVYNMGLGYHKYWGWCIAGGCNDIFCRRIFSAVQYSLWAIFI